MLSGNRYFHNLCSPVVYSEGCINFSPAACMPRLHEVEPLEGLEMTGPSALNSGLRG